MKPHRVLSLSARSLLVVFTTALVIFGIALAADGDLDIGFGSPNGTVANCISSSCHDDTIYDIAIQPDGKVVAVGPVSAGAGSAFGVARYNMDGSLDTTFGAAGKVITYFGAGLNHANDVAIQADGKIVVVGTADADITAVRYNRDGSLDAGFGVSGIVKTNLSSGPDTAWGLAIQPDAKIVVVGSTLVSSHTVYAVVRYNPDGSLDPGFNGSGIFIDGNQSVDEEFYSVAIQPDGKIVAGGSIFSSAYVLARFNADGSLDTAGFGSPYGIVYPTIQSPGSILGLAVQPDGKILAVGDAHAAQTIPGSFLARFNPDGSLDAAGFASPDGYAANHCGTKDEFAKGLALQADGKILVAGYINNGISPDPTVRRYDSAGNLDTSFGSACSSMGVSAGFLGAALQPDGKFLAGGVIGGTDIRKFYLARFLTGSTTVVSKSGAGAVAPALIEPANLMVQFNPGHACTSGVITVTKTLAFPDEPAKAGELPMSWHISTVCPGEYSLKLSLCYTDDELAKAQTLGAVSENNLEVYKFTGGSWVRQGGVVDAGLNCVTLDGVSALSDWTLGDVTFGGPTRVGLNALSARSQPDYPSAGLALVLGSLLVLGVGGVIFGRKYS
jgi:uncharacterized delta-60 repeat protein